MFNLLLSVLLGIKYIKNNANNAEMDTKIFLIDAFFNIDSPLYKNMKKDATLCTFHYYKDISPIFKSSTTAPARPLTPSFCIELEI